MSTVLTPRWTGGLFTNWLTLPRDPEFHNFTLQVTLALFVFWWFMFFVVGNYHYIPASWKKKMSAYDQLVVRHRFVQMYNGAVAWSLAFYWYLYDNDRSCSKRNTTLEVITFSNVAAHFIWDCIFMKWHGFLDMGNLVHHLFGIISYYFSLYYQHNLNFPMLHLLPAEFSNVSMHMREILKRLGMRFTWSYYFNDYLYSVLYIFCRTFWIPSVYYYIFPCETANPAILIIYPFHCLQSWYYVSCLPKMWLDRNKERRQLRDAKLTLNWFEPITTEQAKEAKIKVREPYQM